MISPTLAEFFNVPFFTKMSQENIVLALWNYIINNNFLIDDRLVLLDKLLEPVVHPFFLWKGNSDSPDHTENTIVMVYIAKMHVDPEFIQQDIDSRLFRIRKNMIARRLWQSFLKYKEQSTASSKSNDEIEENDVEFNGIGRIPTMGLRPSPWVKYLATHYGIID